MITASRFWEVQGYVTLTGHVYSPAIVLASPILFDGLTEEQQGWFMRGRRRVGRRAYAGRGGPSGGRGRGADAR